MNQKLLLGLVALILTAPAIVQSDGSESYDTWSYDALPGDHNIRLGNALHARGFDTPFSAECTECHGEGLQGKGSDVPTCYGCHAVKWSEPTPVEIGPIIYFAEYQRDDKKNGKLKISGVNALANSLVTVFNAVTAEVVTVSDAEKNGAFACTVKFAGELPPCGVFSEYTDVFGEIFEGPSIVVLDKQTGQPVQDCVAPLPSF